MTIATERHAGPNTWLTFARGSRRWIVRLGWRLNRYPNRAIAALCLAQIVLWTLAPALSHDAPPLDVVEGYLWGKHLPLATYKHPALPAALLEMSRRLTGAIGWPAYLLSQCAVALTFVCVYLLGRDTLGRQRSLLATVLLTGVYFFMWPSIEFNHNVLQMPLWAGLALALWRGAERGGTVWWILAGLLAGLGLYAKLSTLVFIGCCGVWVLVDARARARLKELGPWVGLGLMLAISAPLYLWLVDHQFQPLEYAAHRGAAMGRFAAFFVVEQILALTVMVLALFMAWGICRPKRQGLGLARPPRTLEESRLLRFTLILLLGPLVVVTAGSLLSGLGLRGTWGFPTLNFAGIVAVLLVGHRLRPAARPLLAVMAAAFLLVTSLGYAITTSGAPGRGRVKRQNFPQAAIATEMRRIFSAQTGRPLTIIATEGLDWPGALAGLAADDMLDVTSDRDLKQTPWVTQDRIAREGMLVVWEAGARRVPENIQHLAAGWISGEATFVIPRSPRLPPLVVGYAVVPPQR
jgi:4-amino-4-deoxy-L-arabinose transferase-like glycosyltransferase